MADVKRREKKENMLFVSPGRGFVLVVLQKLTVHEEEQDPDVPGQQHRVGPGSPAARLAGRARELHREAPAGSAGELDLLGEELLLEGVADLRQSLRDDLHVRLRATTTAHGSPLHIHRTGQLCSRTPIQTDVLFSRGEWRSTLTGGGAQHKSIRGFRMVTYNVRGQIDINFLRKSGDLTGLFTFLDRYKLSPKDKDVRCGLFCSSPKKKPTNKNDDRNAKKQAAPYICLELSLMCVTWRTGSSPGGTGPHSRRAEWSLKGRLQKRATPGLFQQERHRQTVYDV
uniref:Uncharacterized protein n=1 Tax=Branchiostoma floridae TaxID=7739 RepID=C3ZKW9_BRAFL|eukprot:XP_002590640.1 hypothetical protein BRAFLDRAFT_89440 [Branchiostoma floridae]